MRLWRYCGIREIPFQMRTLRARLFSFHSDMSIRGAKPYDAGKVGTPLSRDQHASYRGLIVRNYLDNPTHLETYDHDSPSQSCLETYAGLPRRHFEDDQQCLHNFFRRSVDRFRIIFFWGPFWRYLLASFALSSRRGTVARTADVPAA